MAGPEADHASLSATQAADTPQQTVGSADTPRQTVGSSDTPRQTVGSSDTPQQTVGSADTPRQTVGSSDTPRQTVGSADTPRQTVGSSDTPRQTVGSADTPRQTVGSAGISQRTAGLSFPSDLAAAFAGAVAGSRRQTLGPAAPAPPPLSGGTAPPLLVAVAAGWRAAGDQAASRALRLCSPLSAREPLQDWVDPSTCVLLEREEGGSAHQRPGLTLSVAAGHPLAIAEVAVLSEFGRCELFGDHGEYLATEEAELEETVDDTQVLSLRHRCQPAVTQLTIQCVSAAGRRQLWLYGLEVELQPAPARPSQPAFSLPSVLGRLEAQGTPLSEGAETLRAALVSAGAAGAGGGPAGPPTMAALAAAFAGGCRMPAETSTGAATKLKCEAPRAGGESEAVWPQTAPVPVLPEWTVERCVAAMEERLWQRIKPRLENIERKQDLILERLESSVRV